MWVQIQDLAFKFVTETLKFPKLLSFYAFAKMYLQYLKW